MDKPKLSWYAMSGSDTAYTPTNNINAGSYINGKPLSVKMQLWNNRYGKTDIEDLADFYINMFFKHKEDSALLENCTVILNGSDSLSQTITENIATLQFPNKIRLSGAKNNGASKDNPENFITLEFIFDAPNDVLKEDDLKSLFFQIMTST